MRSVGIVFLLGLFCTIGYSQDIYSLKSGKINFFAGTAVEDINADNNKAISFLSLKTGEITISIPNKEFHFKRSLMEEHFNENYMESDKYDKSEFKGKIKDIETLNFNSKDPITATLVGTLTVHGVAKERSIEVTLRQNKNLLEGSTKFSILLADHNIDRPKILWEKLADKVEVTANFVYELYKK